MAQDVIPEEVKQFILKSIDSIAQLEALLLLRSNPQTQWSTEDVAKRLYISEQETAPSLTRLCAEGFLTVKGEGMLLYKYAPYSIGQSQMVDRLAEIYAKHLVPVTNLIHSKPMTRIQEFADAFRLRKDE